MDRLSVVVKGTKWDAVRAASERGIPFVFQHEVGASDTSSLTVTVGEVPESYRDKVAAWFGEPPLDAPFPLGACLVYSTIRAEDRG
jgi:hypothetical protein